MPVAVAAIYIAFFIDLKPDPRVAQSCRNVAATIAGNTGVTDSDGFGWVGHAVPVAKRRIRRNGLGLEVIERNRPGAGIKTRCLIGAHLQRCPDREEEDAVYCANAEARRGGC